jgi:UDP-glucose 4-epimerase
MTKTLLVTGGGGFVLSHLVRRWLDADVDNRAVVMDVSPLDAAARAWFAGVEDRMRFVQGSVTDPASWDGLDRDAITHIAHAAAVTSINRLMVDGFAGGVPALETNLMGAVRALGFASDCPNLDRMVHVSTGSVYGTEGPEDPNGPLPEDGYIDPDGFYGITKFAGEQIAVHCARRLGMPVVAIRLSSVFGPMDRETAHRAVALPPAVLARRALAGEAVRVTDLGGGFDCIHAADVAEAILALFAAPSLRHTVYNVANGTRYTMGDMVAMVSGIVPGFEAVLVGADEADILVDPAKTGGRWNAYDVSRMVVDTDWRPRALAAALADYIGWLREND